MAVMATEGTNSVELISKDNWQAFLDVRTQKYEPLLFEQKLSLLTHDLDNIFSAAKGWLELVYDEFPDLPRVDIKHTLNTNREAEKYGHDVTRAVRALFNTPENWQLPERTKKRMIERIRARILLLPTMQKTANLIDEPTIEKAQDLINTRLPLETITTALDIPQERLIMPFNVVLNGPQSTIMINLLHNVTRYGMKDGLASIYAPLPRFAVTNFYGEGAQPNGSGYGKIIIDMMAPLLGSTCKYTTYQHTRGIFAHLAVISPK